MMSLLAGANATAHAVRLRQSDTARCQQTAPCESDDPAAFDLLGTLSHQAGRLDEAIYYFRRAVRSGSASANLYSHLGVALANAGCGDEAVAAFAAAARLRPNGAWDHFYLGRALQDQRRYQEAANAYRRTVELRPNFVDALHPLAFVLQELGKSDEAIAAYRQIIALQPANASALNNLGTVLQEQGRIDEALAAYAAASAQSPADPDFLNNLGTILRQKGRFQDAIIAHRRAIALKPGFAEAYANLGNALRDSGDLDGAIAACRHALMLRPDSRDIQFNLAFALLLKGEFEPGWRAFESRRELERMSFPQPRWDGSDLQGARILLHTSKGLGDVVQFVRYARLVAARNGHVIVRSPAPLRRLLDGQEGIHEVVGPAEPLPTFDLHCPLLSLPLVFGTTLATIPVDVPYLRVAPSLAALWRGKLPERKRIRVGLNWAGNPFPPSNRKRAVGLSAMAPLASVRGVDFYSLQKGDAACEARHPPAGLEIVDWSSEQNDFADSAALMSNLDLVITCDTSVAHVAGALGMPVWVLVPFAADWRWMRNRNTSPWYPTMRLFRQSKPGDWSVPVSAVRKMLCRCLRMA